MDFNESAKKYGEEASELFKKGDLRNGAELKDFREMRMKESIGSLQSNENRMEWRSLFKDSFNRANTKQSQDHTIQSAYAMGNVHGTTLAQNYRNGFVDTVADLERRKENNVKHFGFTGKLAYWYKRGMSHGLRNELTKTFKAAFEHAKLDDRTSKNVFKMRTALDKHHASRPNSNELKVGQVFDVKNERAMGR